MPTALPHSARALEFDALREVLRAYAHSPLGRDRVAGLEPSADFAWIERQQQLTEELRQYLRAGGSLEFSGLLDPQPLVDKSRIAGAALEATELRDVVLVVDRAAQWREIALRPPVFAPLHSSTPKSGVPGTPPQAATDSAWPAVAELSSGIADFTAFLGFFRNKLLPDGSLDDRASPELARLRREIDRQKRHIQESLRVHLRRLAEEGAAQEELITIRGERFVIPVKVEQRRKLSGVVHGASSSGQTLFVEPLETIEQNNELVRLLEEELEEVRRILAEMSRLVAAHGDAISRATQVLGELELQSAKARFAEEYACSRPEFQQSVLFLRQARHPLLERNLKARGRRVVPLSLELDADHRQLVITGPNTGGKTVALKTVGLLALMAAAGVPVPADAAGFPRFDAVLADIGDEQSIEQNLSTFSSHITQIDLIARTASARSLVLLDELGAATDPEEGAALAVAIADFFRRRGAMTLIATHHPALKVYAAGTAGVLNAAVGFDEQTLQPTYQLRLGVPGASAGINIAQRLGLDAEIIAAARQRLGAQSRDVARFLDQLHGQLDQLAGQRRELEEARQAVEKEQRRLAAEGMKEQRALLKAMVAKLDNLLRDFEYRARQAAAALAERAAAQKLSREAERRIAKLRREFKEQFDSAVVAHQTGADAGDPDARPGEVKHVAEGDTVKLKSLGRSAVVRRQMDDDTFEVEVGAMKMKVPRGDIAEVVARAGDSPLRAARARGISLSVEESAASEINVIGETVDEATRRVEKFLDHAFLAGLARVRIVHGSGMGVLRKALRQFLKSHPHVASIAEPPQNEGGAGVTVVELRL